jgi:hypothetical protein
MNSVQQDVEAIPDNRKLVQYPECEYCEGDRVYYVDQRVGPGSRFANPTQRRVVCTRCQDGYSVETSEQFIDRVLALACDNDDEKDRLIDGLEMLMREAECDGDNVDPHLRMAVIAQLRPSLAQDFRDRNRVMLAGPRYR